MLYRSRWLAAALMTQCLASPALPADPAAVIAAAISAAITDPRRPPEQVRLDPLRKPALVIAFAGLKPGDRVADFMPGNAYFTRLFSDVVGPSGRVYAFVPTEQVANCPATEIVGIQAI